MKRARVRFLISYRIYLRGTNKMTDQGWSVCHDNRYSKPSLGMIKEMEKVILEREYDLSADTHYLEITSIIKL